MRVHLLLAERLRFCPWSRRCEKGLKDSRSGNSSENKDEDSRKLISAGIRRSPTHRASSVAQWQRTRLPMRGTQVQSRLPMQGAQVQSLGQEDPLQKETATHSSVPAWEIPWQRSLAAYNLATTQPLGTGTWGWGSFAARRLSRRATTTAMMGSSPFAGGLFFHLSLSWSIQLYVGDPSLVLHSGGDKGLPHIPMHPIQVQSHVAAPHCQTQCLSTDVIL